MVSFETCAVVEAQTERRPHQCSLADIAVVVAANGIVLDQYRVYSAAALES
jgi:hypothetical protein